jgi:uncharacterized radical SAM superfamily Fe-S cluster-containing enzyme
MPIQLPLISRPPAATSLNARLEQIRAELLATDEAACAAAFELTAGDRPLKTTISLCPACLGHVPAVVFARGGRVLMHNRCPTHGLSAALVESDIAFYRLSNKDRWGRRYDGAKAAGVMDIPAFNGGSCCGPGGCDSPSDGAPSWANSDDFALQMSNKSCTVLVEVTNACNLACPVCYSDARGDRKMPLDLFKRYMLRLVEAKGGLDSVQLTGGEATLHPEFWEMVRFLHGLEGVARIYLPTNGLLLANADRARRLAEFRDKLMVLLQFDSRDESANRALRAANPYKARDRVLRLLSDLGVCMQLTMTLTRGVNDHDVGWVVDVAMAHSNVKLVALQPVTYSGRYDLAQDPIDRLTLSDVVKAVVAQARRRMRPGDFVPIPCSHPNCGWLTLFARRFGITANVIRRIDLARATDEAAYKTVLSTGEFRRLMRGDRASWRSLATAAARRLIRARDMFAIAVKPFMDRFNYDQDRVWACCHHLLDTRGRPVSFCEYNARLRPRDSWDAYPLLRETEA